MFSKKRLPKDATPYAEPIFLHLPEVRLFTLRFAPWSLAATQSIMLARLLLLLCLCCVVLCAFVGFLSKRAIDEATEFSEHPLEQDCSSFIDSPPKKSSGILLNNFVFFNSIATIEDDIATVDNDGDGKWDEVAIPLFSEDSFKSKVSYTSVIACFRDVPDLKTLHERLSAKELKVSYRVKEQKLARPLHTQLAITFKSMDFRNSPVVTVGYGQDNPILGVTSLTLSYTIGAAAFGVALLNIAYLAFMGFSKCGKNALREARHEPTESPTCLPSSVTNCDDSPSESLLDAARSMRDQHMPA